MLADDGGSRRRGITPRVSPLAWPRTGMLCQWRNTCVKVRRVRVQAPEYNIGIQYDWRGDINDRGDYAPGAFSIQLLFIPEKELLPNIKELQVTIYDGTSVGGLRTRYFFSIKNPLSLKRDFTKRDRDDWRRQPLVAEALVEAGTEVTTLPK